MTIHIVMIVSLMLGVKVTSCVRLGRGAGPMTVWGAGNSSVLSMKQAGNGQARPGAPPAGNGGKRMKARMSTSDHGADEEEPSAAARGPTSLRASASVPEASATGSVATCSLDTLPPHTGARLVAALGSVFPAGLRPVYSIVLRNLLTSR